MTILQEHPAAVGDGVRAEAARVNLLTLAHADRLELDAASLAQLLDAAARVRAHREEAYQGHARLRLLEHAIEVQYDALVESLADRVADVLFRLQQRAVRTPRADEQQLAEHIQRVVVAVRNGLFFRCIFFS